MNSYVLIMDHYRNLGMFIGGTLVGSFLTWSYMNYRILNKIIHQSSKFEKTLQKIDKQLDVCENTSPENIKKVIVDIIEAGISKLFDTLNTVNMDTSNISCYYAMCLSLLNQSKMRNSNQ